MTRIELEEIVRQAIHRIAPEAELDRLDPDVPFRDQFDFDSVDCVNLVEQLQQALDRRVPEIDYPRLATLNGCLAYLA